MCPFCLASMGLIVASATFRRRVDGIGREAVSKEKAGTRSHFPTQVRVADRPRHPSRPGRNRKRYHKKVSADVHFPEAYEVQ